MATRFMPRSSVKSGRPKFVSVPGVSLRTVQDWEQGRRTPGGLAKALLRIAEQQPKALLEIG